MGPKQSTISTTEVSNEFIMEIVNKTIMTITQNQQSNNNIESNITFVD